MSVFENAHDQTFWHTTPIYKARVVMNILDAFVIKISTFSYVHKNIVFFITFLF